MADAAVAEENAEGAMSQKVKEELEVDEAKKILA